VKTSLIVAVLFPLFTVVGFVVGGLLLHFFPSGTASMALTITIAFALVAPAAARALAINMGRSRESF
jgi:hypothetical protein